jgi:hypothetical protein
MKYHYVYRITNLSSGKHYYGSRSSDILPENDLGIQYFSSSHDKLFIFEQKKHPHQFRYKIVKKCKTRKEALVYEIKLHNKFQVDTNDKFYNKSKQTSNGFTYDSTGYVFTDEHRKKLSEAQRNRSPISEETRKKLSDAMLGENNPMYGKSGSQNPFYGKKHTQESKLKMSEKQKLRTLSDETKKKISQSLVGNKRRLGTKASDETRRKLSEAGKGRVF